MMILTSNIYIVVNSEIKHYLENFQYILFGLISNTHDTTKRGRASLENKESPNAKQGFKASTRVA